MYTIMMALRKKGGLAMDYAIREIEARDNQAV